MACWAANLGRSRLSAGLDALKACPGAELPNATYFSQGTGFCINRGSDPLVRTGPPGPAPRFRIKRLTSETGRRGCRPRSRGTAPRERRVRKSGRAPLRRSTGGGPLQAAEYIRRYLASGRRIRRRLPYLRFRNRHTGRGWRTPAAARRRRIRRRGARGFAFRAAARTRPLRRFHLAHARERLLVLHAGLALFARGSDRRRRARAP